MTASRWFSHRKWKILSQLSFKKIRLFLKKNRGGFRSKYILLLDSPSNTYLNRIYISMFLQPFLKFSRVSHGSAVISSNVRRIFVICCHSFTWIILHTSMENNWIEQLQLCFTYIIYEYSFISEINWKKIHLWIFRRPERIQFHAERLASHKLYMRICFRGDFSSFSCPAYGIESGFQTKNLDGKHKLDWNKQKTRTLSKTKIQA